jgi:hypothetical protein
MSVKLERTTIPAEISADNMLDGQIAEIIYNENRSAIGLVVQRYIDTFIILGSSSNNIHRFNSVNSSSIRVRLLEDGEAFTVVENEG